MEEREREMTEQFGKKGGELNVGKGEEWDAVKRVYRGK